MAVSAITEAKFPGLITTVTESEPMQPAGVVTVRMRLVVGPALKVTERRLLWSRLVDGDQLYE